MRHLLIPAGFAERSAAKTERKRALERELGKGCAMNLMNKTESYGLLDFVKVLEEKQHLRFAEGAEA
ncbi:MAG: hypothetical protein IJL70_03120 [Treponema sp.]|nr:hypothetical protein [Treponema sp.]